MSAGFPCCITGCSCGQFTHSHDSAGHHYCRCGHAIVSHAVSLPSEPAPRDYATAWVCTDCYFAHHYGATLVDGKWFAGESDSPCDLEPLARLEGYDLADNTYPEGDDPNEPGETGEQEFSWRSCQGCGSTLGGSRYRLACFPLGREEAS